MSGAAHLGKPYEERITEIIDTLYNEGMYEPALVLFCQLSKDFPNCAEPLMFAGLSAGEGGDKDKGLSLLAMAASCDDVTHDVYFNMSAYYIQTGDMDSARTALYNCLKMKPLFGRAWMALADLDKVRASDPLIGRMQRALKRKLKEDDEYHLRFGLAKAYNDIEQYDRAWYQYKKANALNLSIYPADANLSPGDYAKHYTEVGSTAASTPIDVAVEMTSSPIFIVGFPRSGTTLVEQILGCHSQVEGRGELPFISQFADLFELQGDQEKSWLESLGEVEPETFRLMAEKYLEFANPNNSPFFVDKLPNNYKYIPLIRRMFPDAKILRVIRDPMDTILSCYQQCFTSGQEWSFDLVNAANAFQTYERTMNAIPDSEYDEINYEVLVRQPSNSILQIAELAGLSFEPAMLKPENSDQAVKTASAAQARQEISSGSVGRWKNYDGAELRMVLSILDATIPHNEWIYDHMHAESINPY